MITKLNPGHLFRSYDPTSVELSVSENGPPSKPIIGQERAVRALKFGLGNKAQGFNIYVAGVPGTGKQTAVMHFLKDVAKEEPSPSDWVYVNNFQDPYFPKSLRLPKGKAHEFREDVRHFLLQTHSALIKIFESEEFVRSRDDIIQKMHDEESAIFTELNEKANRENLIIQRTPVEIIALPMVENRVMNEQEFNALSEKEKETIIQKQRQFKEDLRSAARQSRKLELQFNNLVKQLENTTTLHALDTLLEDLDAKYALFKDILTFLHEIKDDILEHLKEFLEYKSGQQGEQPAPSSKKTNSVPRRYDVNILVDNKDVEGAPILLEINPTYNNLFGKIEKESVMGTLVTDFTLIRSGSLHKANGGYLILPIEEVLRNAFSWDSLKRALRNQSIDIEEPIERLGFMSSRSLKPEPIPISFQIILIGRPLYYYLLLQYDEDFKELFKVKAEFDTSMKRSEENILDFIRFIHQVGKQENLLPVSSKGMAVLLEHTHRLAGDQDKISTRFGEIIDLIREAHHYAAKEQVEKIDGLHVQKAIDQRIYRSNIWNEKIQEMIDKGMIIIDLDGSKVGQVNGLSYIGFGDTAFGRPNRITVSVSVGQAGIIDIEREVKLGGPIHSKGVMIITGYLAEKFGQDKSISLSAQLTFEQSYSEVEGDSASSTELYALLSSLSNLPIKQGIAVSGSINQKGEIQAVGGLNEKIEGFYDICKIKGLTGEQGVIIPKSNQKNLMLKKELVEAVRSGNFHLWAIESIEDGIEILTGVKAGKRISSIQPDTIEFEKDSVFEKVNERFVGISKILKKEKGPEIIKNRRLLWRHMKKSRKSF